jgi:SAM-dependent methyltransferase
LTASDANYETWKKALPEEVKFWDEFVATRGGRWPQEFEERMNPALPFERGGQAKWANAPVGSEVHVLDVGAGALTAVGKVWQGRTLKITAVDPLAKEFDRILAAHNVVPPVRTELCDANDLFEKFGADRFDLVYCRNAMDHSPDPLRGIRNCLQVVKPGKYVLLNHFPDEAVSENYTGLHQWNFACRNARFVIWNRAAEIDVAKEVADLCGEIFCELPEPRWHVAALRKRG